MVAMSSPPGNFGVSPMFPEVCFLPLPVLSGGPYAQKTCGGDVMRFRKKPTRRAILGHKNVIAPSTRANSVNRNKKIYRHVDIPRGSLIIEFTYGY